MYLHKSLQCLLKTNPGHGYNKIPVLVTKYYCIDYSKSLLVTIPTSSSQGSLWLVLLPFFIFHGSRLKHLLSMTDTSFCQ